MATTISIPNTVALTACNAIVDACDVGSGQASAILKIYGGTPPTNVDAALSGNTLAAELVMTNPAFGAAADAAPDATATASAITDDSSANASVNPVTFFRIEDRDGLEVIQGTVGTSGEVLNLNSTNIVSGATVSVTSLTITVPEA